MRIIELFENRQPGQYVYHATLRKHIPSILKQGLTPNQGYMGRGVYFAHEPDEGFFHISPDDPDAVILQVSWEELKNRFGTYREKGKGGIEWTEDEIFLPYPNIVPPELIEVYKEKSSR